MYVGSSWQLNDCIIWNIGVVYFVETRESKGGLETEGQASRRTGNHDWNVCISKAIVYVTGQLVGLH